MLSHFSQVWLFATLWTVAHQAPLSMGFSRQEYWSGLPCPPPGDLPNPGIKPMSPALAGGFFTTSATWEALSPNSPVNSWRKTAVRDELPVSLKTFISLAQLIVCANFLSCKIIFPLHLKAWLQYFLMHVWLMKKTDTSWNLLLDHLLFPLWNTVC